MRARFVATTIGCFALLACSQPPPIPDDSGDSQDNASTAKKKKTAPGPDAGDDSNLSGDPFGDDGSDPPPSSKTTQDCKAATSQTDCFTCCQNKNPKSVKFLNAALAACGCKTPGACASQCAGSLCAGAAPKPGDACDKCMTDQQDVCGDQAATACANDASCNALFQCSDDAACFGKP